MVQARAARWILFLVLLLVAAGAAFQGARIVGETEGLLRSSATTEASIAGLTELVADIGARESTYLAADRLTEQPWTTVEALARKLADGSVALRPALRSAEAGRHLQDLSNTLDNLLQIDLQARQSLLNENVRAGSGLIFGDARAALASMTGSLRALEQAERAAAQAERTTLVRRLGVLVAAVTGFWIIGLFVLTPLPRRRPQQPEPAQTATEPEFDLRLDSSEVSQPAPAADPEPASISATPTIDLATAADVCTAMAQATSSEQLPDLLGRAATVLGASGIILWLGTADELFAVTAHGYDPRLLARLGPIQRDAGNATAAAWRTGTPGVVPGGVGANGAIVAPLLGVQTCIGVLAAELGDGREADDAVRAVTVMFAAQLAGIVAAWPAPSSLPGDEASDTSGGSLAASL